MQCKNKNNYKGYFCKLNVKGKLKKNWHKFHDGIWLNIYIKNQIQKRKKTNAEEILKINFGKTSIKTCSVN